MFDSPMLMLIVTFLIVTWLAIPFAAIYRRSLSLTCQALGLHATSYSALCVYDLGMPPDLDKLNILCAISSHYSVFCNPVIFWFSIGIGLFGACSAGLAAGGCVVVLCRRLHL